MKTDHPHPGITMHQIKVGGGFMGLVFTLGSGGHLLTRYPGLVGSGAWLSGFWYRLCFGPAPNPSLIVPPVSPHSS